MSDVSAVVLTLGEAFTPCALTSLAAQTLPPHEIVVIANVSPFYRALNAGRRRVSTPFFVQVDADMILDPNCLELLRGAVTTDTGIVVGRLRDALMGQVVGVKLFRTECFEQGDFEDSISPDTDFGAAIAGRGWKTEYVEHHGQTLGEHRPDYTPAYTFRKALLEGSRYRYRGAREGLRWYMGRLQQSPHELAALAQLAVAHGFFLPSLRDELKPLLDDGRAGRWLLRLGSSCRADAVLTRLPLPGRQSRLREVFRGYRQVGEELAHAEAGASVRELLAGLSGADRDWATLVAWLGLGHGILAPPGDRASHLQDEHTLQDFLIPRRHLLGLLPRLRMGMRW